MYEEKLSIGIIEDVTASTTTYIKEHWGIWYFVPGLLLVIIGIIGATLGLDTRLVAALPLIWFIGGYAYAHGKMSEEFMRQFAKANGFSYATDYPLDMEGTLFQEGHTRRAYNMVMGSFEAHPLQFFNYQFSIGFGKGKQTYFYTVCEITLPGIAPHILVESKNFFDLKSFRKRGQKEMPMESSFRDHFVTYAPEDFDIETFELFTPDVMVTLIDTAKGYDFEFIQNQLYIFQQKTISKRTELNSLLTLAQYLVTIVSPRLLRMQDDITAIHVASGNMLD